jgi:hypothetical protein
MDKLYLEAEGLWRQAHLAAATAALSDARQQAVSSSKCADLQLWVQALQHRMHAAEIACEDGMVLHICVQQQSHMLRHDNTINFPLF